jgi:hypothetical protein
MLRRQREHEQANLLPSQGLPATKIAAVNYQVGDQRSFAFSPFFQTLDQTLDQTVSATVVAINNRAVAFVQNDLRPHQANISTAQIQTFIDQFQQDYPLVVGTFGNPSDVDGDGKVAFLFTHLVDDLGGGGFYCSTSVLPQDFGGNGNLTDMMFISPTSTLSFYRPLLMHEFQHLINFTQHVLVRSGTAEESWLNEGLSHLSEDLVAGLTATSNQHNIAAFFADPSSVGLAGNASFHAGKRGAAYLFVRSLVDRLGTGLIARLVQTGLADRDNIESATGESFESLLAFWTAQLYASGSDLIDHPRLNYTYDQLQTPQGRGVSIPNTLEYRLGGPAVRGAIRPRGVNFVRLQGTGEATVEVRTDPTDPTSKLGAIILPYAKGAQPSVHIPTSFFTGLQLTETVPAIIQSGQTITLKGQTEDTTLTQLLFLFSSTTTEDTLRFLVSVNEGVFDRSIVFNHTDVGTYKLSLFAGIEGKFLDTFLGSFPSFLILPGTDAIELPRRFFSGIQLDTKVPTQINSGQALTLSGSTDDPDLTRIVFDFNDIQTDELVRQSFTDIIDGRFKRTTVFDHAEAGAYKLTVFIGHLGELLDFAGSFARFVVLPSAGTISLPADFFSGLTLDAPLPVRIKPGDEWAISGTLLDPEPTEILFNFSASSDANTIQFFAEVTAGRFTLPSPITFETSKSGSYRLDLFSKKPGETLVFLDGYNPFKVAVEDTFLTLEAPIAAAFICSQTLQSRALVDIPLTLDLTGTQDRVGFFRALISWDPKQLEYSALTSGDFGELDFDLAQTDQDASLFRDSAQPTPLASQNWQHYNGASSVRQPKTAGSTWCSKHSTPTAQAQPKACLKGSPFNPAPSPSPPPQSSKAIQIWTAN